MKPFSNETSSFLQRAEDALDSAKYNLDGGFILAAVNRVYYACYYCITALLDTQSTYAKTHQGAHSKFSELFVKTGLFDKSAAATVVLLFDKQQQADYDLSPDITVNEASTLIAKAKTFYQLTKDYLQQLEAEEKNVDDADLPS